MDLKLKIEETHTQIQIWGFVFKSTANLFIEKENKKC